MEPLRRPFLDRGLDLRMKDERRWVLEGLSSSRPVGLQLQLLQCCCFVFWGFLGWGGK